MPDDFDHPINNPMYQQKPDPSVTKLGRARVETHRGNPIQVGWNEEEDPERLVTALKSASELALLPPSMLTWAMLLKRVLEQFTGGAAVTSRGDVGQQLSLAAMKLRSGSAVAAVAAIETSSFLKKLLHPTNAAQFLCRAIRLQYPEAPRTYTPMPKGRNKRLDEE